MKRSIIAWFIVIIFLFILHINNLPSHYPSKKITLLKKIDNASKITLEFKSYSLTLTKENNIWLASDEANIMAINVANEKMDSFLKLASQPINMVLVEKKPKDLTLYNLQSNEAHRLTIYENKLKTNISIHLGSYSPMQDGMYVLYKNNVYKASIIELEQNLRKLF